LRCQTCCHTDELLVWEGMEQTWEPVSSHTLNPVLQAGMEQRRISQPIRLIGQGRASAQFVAHGVTHHLVGLGPQLPLRPLLTVKEHLRPPDDPQPSHPARSTTQVCKWSAKPVCWVQPASKQRIGDTGLPQHATLPCQACLHYLENLILKPSVMVAQHIELQSCFTNRVFVRPAHKC